MDEDRRNIAFVKQPVRIATCNRFRVSKPRPEERRHVSPFLRTLAARPTAGARIGAIASTTFCRSAVNFSKSCSSLGRPQCERLRLQQAELHQISMASGLKRPDAPRDIGPQHMPCRPDMEFQLDGA